MPFNKSRNDRQIYLGNLSYRATEDQIREAFRIFDIPLGGIRIVEDKETSRAKGFAFVDLADSETRSVKDVVELIDGLEIDGRICHVSAARPRLAKKSEASKGNLRRSHNRNDGNDYEEPWK